MAERLNTILRHIGTSAQALIEPSPSSYAAQYEYTLDQPSRAKLTEEQRKFYEENGFLVIRNLVPKSEIAKYRKRFEQICRGEVKVPGITIMRDVAIAKSEFVPDQKAITKIQAWHMDEGLWEYCCLPQIVDYVECFLKEETSNMKTLAIVVVCFVGTAFCSIADLKPYDQLAAEIFKVEDKNGDGIMSMDDIHSWFDNYDANHDGRMTRHEYTEGVCRETPQLYQLGHYLYDVYDVDHDHHVDRHDWENFLRLMDTGNDGSVTQDEFVKFWVDMFERFENAPVHDQSHAHGHSACH